ncbi:hypothetical protein OQA88_10018 [Cercophora sp. LCS_1]
MPFMSTPRGRLPTANGTVAGTVIGSNLFDSDSESDVEMENGGSNGGIISDGDSDSDVEMADDPGNGSGGGRGGGGGGRNRGGNCSGGGGDGGDGDSSDDDESEGGSSSSGGGGTSGGNSSGDWGGDGDDEGHPDDMESDEGDDEGDDEERPIDDPPIIPPGGENPDASFLLVHQACVTHRDALKQRGDNYKQLYKQQFARVQDLRQESRQLREKIEALELRTWQGKVREVVQRVQNDPNTPMDGWTDIYKRSCKEENMSSILTNIHPDIRLVAPSDIRRPYFSYDYSQFPRRDHVDGEAPFPFLDLPLEVQGKIFKLWLHQEGKLVHCMSRLDPFVAPRVFPSPEQLAETGRSGLPKRFYWGPRHFNLNHDGVEPQDLLRILLVNRHFHYIGTHCFYATNTFAFSSLGELFRFMQGIQRARLDRVQHIEVTFIGNQYLTASPPAPGKPSPFSVRAHALCWLPEARRLRTLVFHINETGKVYIRRRYESTEHRKWMAAKTSGQPNFRETRSFRTIQGMDFIYALRGMTWVRFYDYEKALKPGPDQVGPRALIRDWSFIEDITNVTTMDKVPTRKNHAELHNLAPFSHEIPGEAPPPWVPTNDIFELVKTFFTDYQGEGAYDILRQSPGHRDADFSSRIGTAPPPTESATSYAATDPGSSGSSDGSGGGGGGGGHRYDSDMPSSDSDSGGDTPPGHRNRPLLVDDFSDSDTEMGDTHSVAYSSVGSVHNPIELGFDDEDDDTASDLFVSQLGGNTAFTNFLRAQAPVWLPPAVGSVKSDE